MKLLREAGLLTPTFNIYPSNRVDFVYTYACLHGPSGYRHRKTMSLELLAYAAKGIAYETGVDEESVLAQLEHVEPLLHSMTENVPPKPVSERILDDLQNMCEGEDQYVKARATTSPLVREGVLRSYQKALTIRDNEQRADSQRRMRSPPHRPPRVKQTPTWQPYAGPQDRDKISRGVSFLGWNPEDDARRLGGKEAPVEIE